MSYFTGSIQSDCEAIKRLGVDVRITPTQIILTVSKDLSSKIITEAREKAKKLQSYLYKSKIVVRRKKE
jgi:hypothetical protein